jgi:hypothetical protein
MANTYNYFEAVKADVEEWIENNMDIEHDIMTGTFEDRDEIEEYLNDTLWTEDSVTGNASGSYTFNTYEARENVLADIEAVVEACREYGVDGMGKIEDEEWEYLDVTARCYYLGHAIAEALDEIQDDIDEAIEARDEAADNEEIA